MKYCHMNHITLMKDRLLFSSYFYTWGNKYGVVKKLTQGQLAGKW